MDVMLSGSGTALVWRPLSSMAPHVGGHLDHSCLPPRGPVRHMLLAFRNIFQWDFCRKVSTLMAKRTISKACV